MNKKNAEGYPDPTAYEALTRIEREKIYMQKLRTVLNQVCELSGYCLKGQICVVEKRSGKTYRL